MRSEVRGDGGKRWLNWKAYSDFRRMRETEKTRERDRQGLRERGLERESMKERDWGLRGWKRHQTSLLNTKWATMSTWVRSLEILLLIIIIQFHPINRYFVTEMGPISADTHSQLVYQLNYWPVPRAVISVNMIKLPFGKFRPLSHKHLSVH